VPEASQNTSNGFVIFGWVSTGAEVKCSHKVWKALSQASFHTNLTPFFNNSILGLAILEKSRIIDDNSQLDPENYGFDVLTWVVSNP
jgi:hypothetical protein